jgi:hypothetical protein
MPVMIVPDISLYQQAQRISSPQLLDLRWETMLRPHSGSFQSQHSVSGLLRSALAHTGRAGLNLLTADFSAAGREFSTALNETSTAIQAFGLSISYSIGEALSRVGR